MKRFKPDERLDLSDEDVEQVLTLLDTKRSVEAKELVNAIDVDFATAERLLRMLAQQGLGRLYRRAVDAVQRVAIADIPVEHGYLPLPYEWAYRTIERDSEVRYRTVLKPGIAK